MKTKLLTASAVLTVLSTLTSVGVSMLGTDPTLNLRLCAAATSLITGAIGLFFAGLAYPKELA